MRLTSTPLVLLCLVLSCYPPDLDTFAREHTTPEERAFSANYLHLLSGAQLDSAAALLAPNLRTDTVTRGLEVVSALLRDARLDSLHLIGVKIAYHARTQSRDVNLSYEIPTTGGSWLTANVAARSAQGHTSVIGFSANVVPRRLEELHAFTLVDKSFTHYLWLALAVLVPLVTIAMAIRLIRAKGMPRRWLWAVVALIASPAFTPQLDHGSGGVGEQHVHPVRWGLFPARHRRALGVDLRHADRCGRGILALPRVAKRSIGVTRSQELL
jgi:hypothetical protein